jgi:hypothetical protein
MAPTTLTICCFCVGYVVNAIAASTDSVGAAACETPGSLCENVDLEIQEERESVTARMELLQTYKQNQEHQHDAVSALEFEAFVEKHLRFENQSARDAFITEQVSNWKRYHANVSKGEELGLLSTESVTRRSACALKYQNQYFKPRINLCGNSFTGLESCTEGGCYLLSSFFYDASCHTVYYSNAENQANGYGMCRCMPSSVYEITRYNSASGNNIYSCSSLV